MLVGAIVLGVDDAFEEPHKRVVTCLNSYENTGPIILGFVIWPLVLLFLIARLVSDYVKHTRSNREECKLVTKDWDEGLR